MPPSKHFLYSTVEPSNYLRLLCFNCLLFLSFPGEYYWSSSHTSAICHMLPQRLTLFSFACDFIAVPLCFSFSVFPFLFQSSFSTNITPNGSLTVPRHVILFQFLSVPAPQSSLIFSSLPSP